MCLDRAEGVLSLVIGRLSEHILAGYKTNLSCPNFAIRGMCSSGIALRGGSCRLIRSSNISRNFTISERTRSILRVKMIHEKDLVEFLTASRKWCIFALKQPCHLSAQRLSAFLFSLFSLTRQTGCIELKRNLPFEESEVVAATS